MATYNSGIVYNDQFINAFYNSAPRLVSILENGAGIDALVDLACELVLGESGAGAENIGTEATFFILDDGSGNDSILLTADILIPDTGQGTESILPIDATMAISETGHGLEFQSIAKTFFLVGLDNVLQPLGVIVMRGESRKDLLPGTRENTDKIPGRHGEIDFGSEFQPRVLELRVGQNVDPAEREKLKRTLAKWLNPMQGEQPLIFADDLDKTYYVKYAGKIDLDQWPSWLEFTIPFKAGDPFIVGSFEKTHVGSGALTNEGTFETPVVITITGSVTDPSVVVGGETLTYTGSLASNDTLVIDTGKMSVTFNGVNALANYSGGFPKLQPGDTPVTAAAAGTTVFTWRDRWI